MHSYSLANRDLRNAYLKNPKAKSEYPNNINLKNFNYYLWAPTLSYEPSYPMAKSINIGSLIIRAYQFFATIVSTLI